MRYWRVALMWAVTGVFVQLAALGLDVWWWSTLPPGSGRPWRWSLAMHRVDPLGVAVMRELQWTYHYSWIVERVAVMEFVVYYAVFALECFVLGLVVRNLWAVGNRWMRGRVNRPEWRC